MKQKINLTIDQDIWLEIKTKEINISNLVNEFLKGYIETQNDNIEYEELQKRQKEITEKIIKLKTENTLLLAKMHNIQEEEEKRRKDELDVKLRIMEGFVRSNPAREV